MALLPLLAAILQNETNGGETTGLAEHAAQAAQKIPGQTQYALGSPTQFFGDIADYLTSTRFISSVLATIIVIIVSIVFYRVTVSLIPRILRWRRPDEGASRAAALARIKRQDTAVTLLRNTLRYVTFAVVALFIVGIFLQDSLPTIAGASVLAAIAGFGARDFLRDIIAGFFILFEGQYNVGDFIMVEPTKASGLVEEFGLRTTKIRALSGELILIPNGTITGVTNYVSGKQRFTIEVNLKEEEAADRVLEETKEGHELYLTPPRLVSRNETPDGGLRLRLSAGVLPSTAWLVEEHLVERIKAAAGEDGLAADPLVYKVDEQSIQHVREFIPEE